MGGDGRLPGGRGGGSRPGGGRHRRAAAACPGAAGGHGTGRRAGARRPMDRARRPRRARRGAGLARRPLRRTRGDDAVLAQRPPRARRGRRALVRRVGGVVSHDGHRAPRGRVRDPLRVGQPQGRRVGRRALRGPAHRDLPALRGPRAPDRRRAHARRARRLARSGGHEGRRLASHLVQLRRHQPPGLDPRAGGQRARPRRRSSRTWTAPTAVVDLAVGLSNRAGPRTIAVRGTLAGTAVRFGPVHLGRGERATVHARVRIPRPDLWEPGHPTLEGLRLEVPGEAVFTARVGLREVRWAGRAPGAQRRGAEAARRLAAGGRARAAATRSPTPTRTRSSLA